MPNNDNLVYGCDIHRSADALLLGLRTRDRDGRIIIIVIIAGQEKKPPKKERRPDRHGLQGRETQKGSRRLIGGQAIEQRERLTETLSEKLRQARWQGASITRCTLTLAAEMNRPFGSSPLSLSFQHTPCGTLLP